MNRDQLAEIESTLVRSASGQFTDAELDGLPDPVHRFLFDGVTIPDAGRLDWHYGTDRWNEGEFFRYHITDLTAVTDPAT